MIRQCHEIPTWYVCALWCPAVKGVTWVRIWVVKSIGLAKMERNLYVILCASYFALFVQKCGK